MIYKKSKLVLVLFFLMVVSYFTSDFNLIDIEKTAIIAAIGIDCAGDELCVTAQVAIPQATNQSATNSDAIITAQGKTVFDALDNISKETGWHPKLTFCNLVVLGNKVVSGKYMPIIDFLLTSNRFQNSAVLAAAETTAKEILSSSTPLDHISSFALQKILLKNYDKANPVLKTDIREFSASSRSHSSFAFMPLIKVIQTDDKSKGDDSGQQNSSMSFYSDNDCKADLLNRNFMAKRDEDDKKTEGKSGGEGNGGDSSGGSGGGSGGSGGGQQGKEGSSVFDATYTNLFSNGKYCCSLSPEQTNVYALLTKSARESFMPVTLKRNNRDVNALITIVRNQKHMKLKIVDGVPYFDIKLTLICEKEELYGDEDIGELKDLKKVSDKGLAALKEKTEKIIEEIVDISKTYDCDLFQVKDKLYQFNHEHFYDFEKDILSRMKVNILVDCINRK